MTEAAKIAAGPAFAFGDDVWPGIAKLAEECGEVEETHCQNFSGALAKIRSHGWAARKDGDDWFHYCGDCK